MTDQDWWSKLPPATRAWLVANNGDAVPESIAAEVAAVGCPVAVKQAGDDATRPGLFYPDEIIDWLEEVANDEEP